jgi:DedD protein
MDQSLKERLIGAAVLVALGVWLIPWVLDGQDEQSESRSTALQLPVTEQPVPIRSQTIRLDEERQAPAPAAESTLKVVAAQDPEPATVATADIVAEDAPPVVTTALVERDVEKSQPVTPPETATSAAPASAAPPPSTESAPTPSAASSAPTRSAAVASSQSGWFVQLGSFGEEENARRLAQRVSTFGYRADITTHRASGRVMYRVRVGPEGSRGRAQAAASALTAHGFPAQIVAAD